VQQKGNQADTKSKRNQLLLIGPSKSVQDYFCTDKKFLGKSKSILLIQFKRSTTPTLITQTDTDIMRPDITIQYLAAILAFVGLLLALIIGAACGLLLTRDTEQDEGEKVTAIRDVFGCSKRKKTLDLADYAKQIPGVDASQIQQV